MELLKLMKYEIIDKKPEVNRVNSKTQKNFLSPRASPDRTHPDDQKS